MSVPPPIVANPARKQDRDETPPAWKLHDAAAALRRERLDAERAEARPVKLVDLELPLGAVFALYVQVAIIQLVVAAVVVVVLFAVGIL